MGDRYSTEAAALVGRGEVEAMGLAQELGSPHHHAAPAGDVLPKHLPRPTCLRSPPSCVLTKIHTQSHTAVTFPLQPAPRWCNFLLVTQDPSREPSPHLTALLAPCTLSFKPLQNWSVSLKQESGPEEVEAQPCGCSKSLQLWW